MLDLNEAQPALPFERFDLDAIVARLRKTADQWVPRVFPYGRRVGDEWRLANIKGHPPRKQGSCVVALAGDHAGDWIDFDGGEGGGPLNTLEHGTGLTGRELFAHAADSVGLKPGAPPTRLALAASPRSAAKDHSREIEFILSKAGPIEGTLAERYLRSRGLSAIHCADLLFHPDLTHWESRRGFPGIVAVVRDRSGNSNALHRTYLADDGTTKAPVDNPRKMLAATCRGAVRLAEPANGLLGLAEGIETALSVMAACPHLPVWAALSASNLEQAALPSDAQRIVILADHDSSGAGKRAAQATAHRLTAEGRRVWIALPPKEGEDFNDLLRREGPEAVKVLVERATEWNAKHDPEHTAISTKAGTHRPIGLAKAGGRRPTIRSDNGDLAHATRLTWDALLAANDPPWLFRSGGRPAWVVRDDDGLPMAQPLTEDRMRSVLAELIDWRKLVRAGDLVPAYPPAGVIKSILATPDPSLPVLAGIATTPVFGRNGELITEPGYHPSARLLYDPPAGFAIPSVPAKPTQSEIAAARTLLLDDLFGDFPFTGEAERAHALALLLVGFVRAMIDGATPLHVVEKPTQGTGATLMIDAISVVATSHRASVMVEGSDDEEWRKRLTAKLRQIPSLVLIDNLRRPLDSAALAAALTAPFWEDRVLGVSEITRLPIRCIWVATGNNPEFSGEIARRLVRIRLDARVDQPWRRSEFRHPNLMVWLNASRAQLVTACLTLCRAWIAVGMPGGSKTVGSFEAWATVMGGILDVVGVPGFLGNIDEMLEASDGEGSVWRVFVRQWWDRFGTADVGTSDLYELALACEPPLPLGAGGDHSRRIRLGKSLARMRDRVFDIAGLKARVSTVGVSHQARRWKLAVDGECGECLSGLQKIENGECQPSDAQYSPQYSPGQPIDVEGIGGCGECGEYFPTLTHARAHTILKEGDSNSPSSQHSPTFGNHSRNSGECSGECRPAHPPRFDPPDWLKEVP